MSIPKDWKSVCYDPLCEKWTVEHRKLHDVIIIGNRRIELPLAFKQSEQIADAHNAALAAAKAGGWLSQEALDEYAKVEQEFVQLRDQLATLVDALEWYAEGLEPSRAIAALAKVKEGR